MTPRALSVYRDQKAQENKARMIATDISSWMTGAYVLKAIGCALSSQNKYPESNVFFVKEVEITEEEKEEIIKENTQIAASNFKAWAAAANKSRTKK